jgi:heterodisulfide reductase subunit C
MSEAKNIKKKLRMSRSRFKSEFLRKVEDLSGEKIYACYQCGKCSAGCPIADDMDILPNQLIRNVQLGNEDVLDSRTIWLCASCFTCGTRCPHGIDIARVMEALRQFTLRKNEDDIRLGEADPEVLRKAPQQLVVCTARKYTA